MEIEQAEYIVAVGSAVGVDVRAGVGGGAGTPAVD